MRAAGLGAGAALARAAEGRPVRGGLIGAGKVGSMYLSQVRTPVGMHLIGIADLAHPDYGDAVALMPGEIPVFWACGVTPQSAILNAQPAFCITHAPGCMLVTDLLNHQLASF